ncbi:MAG: transcription repressor NadR [Defluviitaleaceae bacterium]|nr:transcription repressor NadR [Defluviitaleaceae bacterium]
MKPNERRKMILEAIKQNDAPLSATALASNFGVTRQVVVGDVSLLRASGHDIIATARGYIIYEPKSAGGYIGTIACRHNEADTAKELHTIIDLGASIINVTVEHEIYGEITGVLNINTHEDADDFLCMVQNSEAKLLLQLSHNGVHLHQIACCDKTHFEQIVQALDAQNFLYNGA